MYLTFTLIIIMLKYFAFDVMEDFAEGWLGVKNAVFYWHELVSQPYDSTNKGLFEFVMFFFQPWSANVVEKHISDVLDAF